MKSKYKSSYNLSPQKTKELITQYNESNDEKEKESIRDKILLGHTGIVGKIAHNFSPHTYCYEDMFQSGFLALVQAFEKYDCTRKVPFHLFAWMVITRKLITASYRNQYGWLAQLAGHHQLTKKGDDYEKLSADQEVFPDSKASEKHRFVDTLKSDDDTYQEVDEKDFWEYIIKFANPLQRESIDMHYRQGLTTRKIAKKLGCSIGAVNQRIEMGRRLIKKKMEEQDEHME